MNGIIGDETATGLPELSMDEDMLVEEKKMVKYSKTAEFKRIQEWCDLRIDFYQKYLPNGLEVGLDVVPSTEDWRVANRVIGELTALKNMYAIAKDAVDGV